MTFSQRSYQKELLDQDNIPFPDILQNMKELNFINTWLGGHKITIDGFKELASNRKQISVCEIGCGGGDNLVAINNYCSKKKIDVQFTGIDIKKECIDVARSRKTLPVDTVWIANDYQQANFTSKPDIIFSSLFCHHFTDDQLLDQLRWMKDNSRVGFFINDLNRNVFAYYSIKLLTKVFSSSYLVKNDAPLSVLRGFSRKELHQLCSSAGIQPVNIQWKWAFRFLVTYKNE